MKSIHFFVRTSGPIPCPAGVMPNGMRFTVDGGAAHDVLGAGQTFDLEFGDHTVTVQRIDVAALPFGPLVMVDITLDEDSSDVQQIAIGEDLAAS